MIDKKTIKSGLKIIIMSIGVWMVVLPVREIIITEMTLQNQILIGVVIVFLGSLIKIK